MKKAISVKQPWAYLLCAGIKDIENRTWKLPEKYKGEWILIHASGSLGKKFNINLTDEQMIAAFGSIANAVIIGTFDFGAIVGAVKFSECVMNANSIWAEKSVETRVWANGTEWFIPNKPIYNWVVQDAVLFDDPIRNIKGKLSFWEFDLPEEYQNLLID